MTKKLLLSAAVALAVGGFSLTHTPPAQATGWGADRPRVTLIERLHNHFAAKFEWKRRWLHEKMARKGLGMHRRTAEPVGPPPAEPPRRGRPLK